MSGIGWSVNGRRLLDNVSFALASGKVVGLIGPNGSGKTSLLRCIAGLQKPDSGSVHFYGEALSGLSIKSRAHRLAFAEQMQSSNSELRARDIVALGRIPFRQTLGGLTEADRAIVDAAIEAMGLKELANQSWHTMSGGEQQRVNIARALAQRAKLLLLDEPTNHLDIRHQLDILRLLRRLPQTVLVCLHDLNLAARYCHDLIVMKAGRIHAVGPPQEVLTPDIMREVFGIEARLDYDEDGTVQLRIAH